MFRFILLFLCCLLAGGAAAQEAAEDGDAAAGGEGRRDDALLRRDMEERFLNLQRRLLDQDGLMSRRMEHVEARIDSSQRQLDAVLLVFALTLLLGFFLVGSNLRARQRWALERVKNAAKDAENLMNDIRRMLDRPELEYLRISQLLRRLLRQLRDPGETLPGAQYMDEVRAAGNDPHLPAALHFIARILTAEHDGNWNIAAQTLEQLREMDAKDPDVLLHLSHVHKNISVRTADRNVRNRHQRLSYQYYAQFTAIMKSELVKSGQSASEMKTPMPPVVPPESPPEAEPPAAPPAAAAAQAAAPQPSAPQPSAPPQATPQPAAPQQQPAAPAPPPAAQPITIPAAPPPASAPSAPPSPAPVAEEKTPAPPPAPVAEEKAPPPAPAGIPAAPPPAQAAPVSPAASPHSPPPSAAPGIAASAPPPEVKEKTPPPETPLPPLAQAAAPVSPAPVKAAAPPAPAKVAKPAEMPAASAAKAPAPAAAKQAVSFKDRIKAFKAGVLKTETPPSPAQPPAATPAAAKVETSAKAEAPATKAESAAKAKPPPAKNLAEIAAGGWGKVAGGIRSLSQLVRLQDDEPLPFLPAPALSEVPKSGSAPALAMWREIRAGDRVMAQATAAKSLRERNRHIDGAIVCYARAQSHKTNETLYHNWGIALLAKALHVSEKKRAPFYNAAVDKFLAGNVIAPHYFDFYLASLYAIIGDKDECLKWLKKARESGRLDAQSLMQAPDFDAVRGEPWFDQFLES